MEKAKPSKAAIYEDMIEQSLEERARLAWAKVEDGQNNEVAVSNEDTMSRINTAQHVSELLPGSQPMPSVERVAFTGIVDIPHVINSLILDRPVRATRNVNPGGEPYTQGSMDLTSSAQPDSALPAR